MKGLLVHNPMLFLHRILAPPIQSVRVCVFSASRGYPPGGTPSLLDFLPPPPLYKIPPPLLCFPGGGGVPARLCEMKSAMSGLFPNIAAKIPNPPIGDLNPTPNWCPKYFLVHPFPVRVRPLRPVIPPPPGPPHRTPPIRGHHVFFSFYHVRAQPPFGGVG